MSSPHPQRVAWDGARVIVHAAADRDWAVWFANWMHANVSPEFGPLVMQTRTRLVTGYGFEAAAVESGLWRVRLGDLFQRRPDLVEPLAEIVRETSARSVAAA